VNASEGHPVPRLLSRLLNEPRVQDCLWVGLMEWNLRIDRVALRPRPAAEGGIHPSGWVLWVGLGPGVRLEVTADREDCVVREVRMVIDPAAAPRLLRRSLAPPERAIPKVTG
jgi:hypothetical protein